MSRYLSKSKLLSFLQCPRRLYLGVRHPELAEVSSDVETVMAVGHQVGEVARSLYPGGVLIESQENLTEAMRRTEAALARRPKRAVFEGTFQHDGVLVRTDLLLPASRRWQLVEVKSSTSVKDYHRADAAIQRYVLERAGVPVGEVAIRVINNQFVYPGNGVYHEVKRNGAVNSLFTDEDVTDETRELTKAEVPAWIEEVRQTLARRTPPPLTDRCNDPFPCPFQASCYPEETEYPVDCLPGVGPAKAAALRTKGYEDIRDIPPGELTNERQERVRRVTVAGIAERLPGAAEVLSGLGYPRYYLDFETINFAVPIWKGVRPYQQVPFQWSCHVEYRDGTIEHREFLDLSGDDPSRAFAERLIEQAGEDGPVLVYNQGFEGRVLSELATRYRRLAPALSAIRERLVDLWPVTRDAYYHPAMRGSWSIKAVLPTIAPDLDYAQLVDVHGGGEAQAAYSEAISPDTSPERRRALDEALRVYCGRDTEAMVRLAHFLADDPSAESPMRRRATRVRPASKR